MAAPLAYFITFTTYGTWLHGNEKGSVDRQHNEPGTPFLPADAGQLERRLTKMNQAAYVLDQPRRAVVLNTILEVSRHRDWKLWAVHVRSNHVHLIVTADATPEKVMIDFKAWCSRRLREAFLEPSERNRWTQHGSTRYLNTEASFHGAVAYVLQEQGTPMEVYDGTHDNEPEA